jgi:sporulation-control protein spo0M
MIILRNIDIEVKFDNGVPVTFCNTSVCVKTGFAIYLC